MKDIKSFALSQDIKRNTLEMVNLIQYNPKATLWKASGKLKSPELFEPTI